MGGCCESINNTNNKPNKNNTSKNGNNQNINKNQRPNNKLNKDINTNILNKNNNSNNHKENSSNDNKLKNKKNNIKDNNKNKTEDNNQNSFLKKTEKVNSQLNDNSKINNYSIDYSNLIGKGAFGKIYLSKDLKSGKDVAIKIEENNEQFSYLLNEYKAYQKLGNYDKIPKIYDCFQRDNKNYLVMDVLGSSLNSLFKQNHKIFSLATVLNIGLQIVDILEYIHSKNIIHRDIKPDCFLIGKEEKTKIYIIDFGFAKNFIDTKLNIHYPLKKDRFVGNYKFTSNSSIIGGYKKSRRDDIESLAYMLIYFLKGSLPWENKTNKEDIKKIRSQTHINTLCEGLPLEIKSFLIYSLNLKFFERPNYDYLRQLLNNCSKYNKVVLKNNYDWIKNIQAEKLETKSFVNITNKDFDNLSAVANSKVGVDDRSIIEKNYTKNPNSFKLNAILRTKGVDGLDEDDYETFYALYKAIKSYKTEEDYLVHRYVDNHYLKGTFKFNPSDDINFNLQKVKEQIGSIKIEKGFMSCFMTDNHIIKRNVKLEIKIPKGTNAYITQNKEESELILNINTEYQIMDAKIVDDIIQIDVCILNNRESSLLFSLSNNQE